MPRELTIKNIISLLCLCKVVAAQYVGDYCTLTETGETGQCILLVNCPVALNALQTQQKFPQTCGFEGTQPIVCCSQTSSTTKATPKPTTRSTTVRTTTTSRPTTRRTKATRRTTTQVSVKGPRVPGAISRAKCKDYGKYVYSIKKSPTLQIDAEDEVVYECGFRVIPLIVGGEEANRKEFPHMAAIGFGPTLEEAQWICGGSIISEEYILTAAHCLSSQQYGPAKYVKVGITNLKDPRLAKLFEIAESIRHPQYQPPSHYHDIALLKLNTKIKPNGYARPACIHTATTIPASRSIASGWGKTDFSGSSSDNLLKVVLDLIPHATCADMYSSISRRKLPQGILDEQQVCAGSLDGKAKDTCQGDSGGPLQIYHPEEDVKCMYDIVGITSFGKACGIGNSAGVYTRVANYTQWIEDIVWP